MKQYHTHYTEWEDYINGMWRPETKQDEEFYLQKAIDFTGNTKLYGKWMLEVLEKWPITCNVNLSNKNQNRKAWIGHAACCLAINCPEQVTRMAWWKLTEKQRIEANLQAQYAIELWEETELFKTVGKQLFFNYKFV